MTLQQYCAAALALFRRQPDTSRRTSRQDREVAAHLYRRNVALDILAHVMRLARLRRAANSNLGTIRSLAYYRTVLDSLPPEDLEPDYIAYVAASAARLDQTNRDRFPSRSAGA